MRPVTDSPFYIQDLTQIVKIKIKILTLNGDTANIHEPKTHLSPDCATTCRQKLHCELGSAAEFKALAPSVGDHKVCLWSFNC